MIPAEILSPPGADEFAVLLSSAATSCVLTPSWALPPPPGLERCHRCLREVRLQDRLFSVMVAFRYCVILGHQCLAGLVNARGGVSRHGPDVAAFRLLQKPVPASLFAFRIARLRFRLASCTRPIPASHRRSVPSSFRSLVRSSDHHLFDLAQLHFFLANLSRVAVIPSLTANAAAYTWSVELSSERVGTRPITFW